MTGNQYTDMEVRPQRHFLYSAFLKNCKCLIFRKNLFLLDLIHLRLVTKTQCFGSRMCCRLQMGETNLSGGPLTQSYCHSLVLFAISPARILIKNLILSILSNVYGPWMFSGFGSSKDTVPCPLAHLLSSFVAPADRLNRLLKRCVLVINQRRIKNKMWQFRHITHHRQTPERRTDLTFFSVASAPKRPSLRSDEKLRSDIWRCSQTRK